MSLASSEVAHAQIERHDLRLFLEGGMLTWSKTTIEYEGGSDFKATGTALGVGPLTSGGLGVGFAVTRFLIPTLSFSMQRVKLETEGTTAQDLRVWELRPTLEVALLPTIRFVPFVSAGMSVMGSVDKDAAPPEFEDAGEPRDVKRHGYGPVLQAGLHTFVLEHASLDLSLAYRALFNFMSTTPVTTEEGDLAVPSGGVVHSLLLNLAASFWLL